VAVPLFYFFAFAGGAFFRLPAGFVLQRLLFQVVEGFADGGGHVFGLGQAYDGAVARADGDFGFVAVFFYGEDHLGFEAVAQDLADFCEAGFNLFADGGSHFVVTSSVFHVQERPS
jgi:hypothetical protein